MSEDGFVHAVLEQVTKGQVQGEYGCWACDQQHDQVHYHGPAIFRRGRKSSEDSKAMILHLIMLLITGPRQTTTVAGHIRSS